MSEVDRTELRKLAEAATPGPWWQEWVDGDEWYAVSGQPTGDLVCPEVCTTGDVDDANLLVAAVNALPGLLDALEKAEAHRDSLAATLIEVQREKLAVEAARDRYGHAHKACHEQREESWAAIDRVRGLHAPANIDVLPPDCTAEDCEHEDECPTVEREVCEACYDLGESIDVYGYERGGIEHVFYPCPTIQALDGGGPDE